MKRPPSPLMTVESPLRMTISVSGLAVARKTLPAARDEAAAPPAAKIGCSQTLSITPPDLKGRPSSHEVRSAALMSRPRSTTATDGCPSDSSTCPTGWRGGACGTATIAVSASFRTPQGLPPPNPMASKVSSSGETRCSNAASQRMSPATRDRTLFLLSLIDDAVSLLALWLGLIRVRPDRRCTPGERRWKGLRRLACGLRAWGVRLLVARGNGRVGPSRRVHAFPDLGPSGRVQDLGGKVKSRAGVSQPGRAAEGSSPGRMAQGVAARSAAPVRGCGSPPAPVPCGSGRSWPILHRMWEGGWGSETRFSPLRAA